MRFIVVVHRVFVRIEIQMVVFIYNPYAPSVFNVTYNPSVKVTTNYLVDYYLFGPCILVLIKFFRSYFIDNLIRSIIRQFYILICFSLRLFQKSFGLGRMVHLVKQFSRISIFRNFKCFQIITTAAKLFFQTSIHFIFKFFCFRISL